MTLHPYAAFYAGFGDFNLWRIRPMGALFVGGFARAHRLRRDDLASAVPALEAFEADVVAHCNADHADTMTLIANDHGYGGPSGGWRHAMQMASIWFKATWSGGSRGPAW